MFVPWHLHDTYDKEVKEPESNFIETGVKDKDKQSTVYHRYYHVFREGELESLIHKNF